MKKPALLCIREKMIIYSTDNKVYKLCKSLAAKKYRDRLGKYLIEGENLLTEAARSGADVELAVVREDCERAIPAGLPDSAEVVLASRELFARLAQTETSQGLLAVVRKPGITAAAFYRTVGDANVLVLDRLQDPGNIGTMLRTAEAAGYGGVVALRGTGDIYAPKTVRAAAGTAFRMPVLQEEDASVAGRRLKEQGKSVIVTCMDGDFAYYDADLSRNAALVIGNEGNGVSAEWQALADVKVRLPMRGQVESLNAAVAAAILMYEAVRKKTEK